MSTTSSSPPSAEIVTIGTELLLGETLDTNTGEIARRLGQIGLDVYRTSSVGDNVERIAAALRESLGRASVVITTGGLGPTVDDPTREAAAAALGTALVFDPALWTEIQERFARFGRTPTENNRRQAMLPKGARPILNPVGTAPAFVAEVAAGLLIALPGVPAEMRWLMENEVVPLLRRRLDLPTALFTRTVRVAGVGESWLDEKIRDLEEGSDPTVGVMAHPGRVDVRIATKAADAAEAERRMEPIQQEILHRLGEAVYGIDRETLEAVTMAALGGRGWSLAAVERGTAGALAGALGDVPVLSLPGGDREPLEGRLASLMAEVDAQAGLSVEARAEGPRQQIEIGLLTPEGSHRWRASFGGSPELLGAWAVSLALDHVRRWLMRE